MSERLRITLGNNTSVTADLLWNHAPATCRAVVDSLPLEYMAFHAMYSGSEIALEAPTIGRLSIENPTTRMRPWELAYIHLGAEEYFGVDSDTAEIAWVYDVDGQPAMFEGAVPCGVFARIAATPEFYDACVRMRRAGEQVVRIELER
jgi:hypothetical protein